MNVFIVRAGKDLHQAKAILKNNGFEPEMILVSDQMQYVEQVMSELEGHYPNSRVEKATMMAWGPKGEPLPESNFKTTDGSEGE